MKCSVWLPDVILHSTDRQTDRQAELLVLAPCIEFEAAFKSRFKIGSTHTHQQTDIEGKPNQCDSCYNIIDSYRMLGMHTHTHAQDTHSSSCWLSQGTVSCFRFLWFAQPVGTFWLRWTWHKIKCSILIELSASYHPNGTCLSSPYFTICWQYEERVHWPYVANCGHGTPSTCAADESQLFSVCLPFQFLPLSLSLFRELPLLR